jgi:NAD(P)-dependent dehydrogenase (short-subunit alcohol dehydrogenase family)
MSLLPLDALKGRTALVTGASGGIGLAVAQALAEAGAWVGMVARTERDLARAAERIVGHAIPADVSSPTDVHRVATYLSELLGGPPDLLVNAAGTFALAPFADTDPLVFDQQIGANLRGPFLVTRAFLPAMLERGDGHVINIGSVAGRVALPGNSAYAASKFGLRGMHEVLAEEVRGTGVRVTLIEPSATDTSLWDPFDPDARADLPSRNSMLRPEDVARAVAFVAAQPRGVEIQLLSLRAG